MRNMLDKTNQKLKNIERKNNKGFTLVELIIVIAIIAVLAAVLAPQYVRYLERSRIGTDNNCLGEIAHAAEVEAVTEGNGTIVVTTTGSLAYGSGTNDALNAAVAKTVPAGSYKFVSDAATKTTKIVTITVDKGVAKYTALKQD